MFKLTSLFLLSTAFLAIVSARPPSSEVEFARNVIETNSFPARFQETDGDEVDADGGYTTTDENGDEVFVPGPDPDAGKDDSPQLRFQKDGENVPEGGDEGDVPEEGGDEGDVPEAGGDGSDVNDGDDVDADGGYTTTDEDGDEVFVPGPGSDSEKPKASWSILSLFKL